VYLSFQGRNPGIKTEFNSLINIHEKMLTQLTSHMFYGNSCLTEAPV